MKTMNIILPMIHAMMSGVSIISINHPQFKLTYVDGSTEEATCEDLTCDSNSFAIISAVQSQRKGEAK